MSKDFEATFYLWATIIGLVVSVLISVYYGWAFSIMWEWFVTPTTSIHIGTAQAAGVVLMARMVTSHPTESKCGTKLKWGNLFFLPLFTLGFGFILKAFM